MNDDRQHLVEMAKHFSAAFLVTHSQIGKFHGRPMELAKVGENGELYFSASLNSLKMQELSNDPSVGVFFQDSRSYVSIYGRAEVIRDRALIEELWQESWKLWFPEGKGSPDLCLIKVNPETGEYWDLKARHGARFLFETVKAYATGAKLSENEGHAKVSLG